MAVRLQVYDKEREWRAADGRRGFFPPPIDARDTRESSGQGRWEPQRESSRDQTREAGRDAGRNKCRDHAPPRADDRSAGTKRGRDSVEGADRECLSDSEIALLLGQREVARSAKDWELADRYRDQLRQGKIDVFDKEKEWRCTADGRRGSILGPDAVAAASTLSDSEIEALVMKREDARRSKVCPSSCSVASRALVGSHLSFSP